MTPPVMRWSWTKARFSTRADAERGHAEVVRLEPQCRDADDVGEGAGSKGGNRHAEPRREPVAHRKHRRHVSAEPVEAGMSERDLPRIAHQEIQADGEDDVDPRQDHDVDEVLVGQEPGHHGHCRQEGHERPAGHPAGQRVPSRPSPSTAQSAVGRTCDIITFRAPASPAQPGSRGGSEGRRGPLRSPAGFAGATQFSGRFGGGRRGLCD